MSNLSSYTLGLVFILLVAIIWSVASIVVQYLYRDQSFDAPFLLTYISTSLFVVQLPLHWLYKRWEHYQSNVGGNHTYDSIPSDDEGNELEERNPTVDVESSSSDSDTTEYFDGNIDERNRHWTERDHMIAAAKLCPFWFLSNFAYNSSLQYTSITSSTVLVNTGSLFAFSIAVMMRDERFNCWKFLGVMLGMAGCVLTGLHDARDGGGDGENRRMRFLFGDILESDGSDASNGDEDLHLWGDFLSVFSAAFYGVYTVMVRVLCPRDESLMSMQLFFGYIGLWNMLALSPIAIYQLGTAKSVTLSAWVFSCLVVNGLFNSVISDYLWARSVVLTSATVASVGLGLTIPLAFASDVFLGVENVMNFESIFGAGFVLFGFVLVNIGQKQDDKKDTDEHNEMISNED
mmetsp:Transcript_28479/g.59290  ORF Transcript_28479/g.59290 Transcript_28479/m.59290 type:complete len:404 (-) Transcript_28479:198-1409(-)